MPPPNDRLQARRLVVAGIVGSLCLTGGAAIAALLVGDFDDTDARILLTTGSISFYGLLSLPGTVLLEQRRGTPPAYAAVGLALLGLALALNLVWLQWDDADERSWKSLVLVTAFAAAFAQIAAAETRRRPDDTPVLRRLGGASAATALVLAALISYAAFDEVDQEGYYRFLGAVAVLNVLVLALPPVIRRGGARQPPTAHRFVCVLDAPAQFSRHGFTAGADSHEIECELDARDFADAVAAAIRELERGGRRVVRVERPE